MDNKYIFTGNKKSLRDHWENEDRAIKFLSGGTRSQAVKFALNKIRVLIKDEIWIDVASGSGFVQSILNKEYLPSFFVSIDFSMTMLRTQNPLGERVQASLFHLPVRSHCSDVSSIFFCLSDYPNLQEGIISLARILSYQGTLSFVDYAYNDEYWNLRKSMDGIEINGNKIIGNINLRNLDDIVSCLPKNINITNRELIGYNVPRNNFNDQMLPINTEFVYRSFIFIIAKYNPNYP